MFYTVTCVDFVRPYEPKCVWKPDSVDTGETRWKFVHLSRNSARFHILNVCCVAHACIELIRSEVNGYRWAVAVQIHTNIQSHSYNEEDVGTECRHTYVAAHIAGQLPSVSSVHRKLWHWLREILLHAPFSSGFFFMSGNIDLSNWKKWHTPGYSCPGNIVGFRFDTYLSV